MPAWVCQAGHLKLHLNLSYFNLGVENLDQRAPAVIQTGALPELRRQGLISYL